jgi:hypothetical protein
MFGATSLIILVSLMLTIPAVREWQAWSGQKLFEQGHFERAAAELEQLSSSPTVFGTYFAHQHFKYFYSQSLLVQKDRETEAVGQFAYLSNAEPADPLAALVMAVHEWGKGNRESALRRLEAGAQAHCPACKSAHGVYSAAVGSQLLVPDAKDEQERAVEAMERPARCFAYRGGLAAGGELLPHRAKQLLDRHIAQWIPRDMTKAAAKHAKEMARRYARQALRKASDMVKKAADLYGDCLPVELHKVLGLKDVIGFDILDQWVGLQNIERLINEVVPHGDTVINGGAAAYHLAELGSLATRYGKARAVENDAIEKMAQADKHAGDEWLRFKMLAKQTDFRAVAVLEPEDKGNKSVAEKARRVIDTIQKELVNLTVYLWSLVRPSGP